ncbi:glycosyl transferase family 2 [Mucilaginibacter frigoritolerans]|jgi:glycosyltransferase involved in cell wall biosynthesis|uniref:Glycosyl transferase family 2 n=1 Tax=Mucilaginibacter frigoritolerans TaxID=652788 RepID=A0A562TPY8_9SPHI|nr:glycosyltransferase family 2 protein [Mucilaginibacter frigoritolerans]TWI95625.1 glycosyl transferase family 2 [Mucilaginibacter frigoritolerans]
MSVRGISVIIATFNGEKYILKQLESILNQSLIPDEIIICDDKSSDGTVAIINALDNNIIKLHTNEYQLGVVENFKKAAKLASPVNWIAFADQDDIWEPNKLQLLAAEMTLLDNNFTPALVYSNLKVIDKNENVISESFWMEQKINPCKINLSTLLYGNVVTGCTMIINHAMAAEFFLMDSSACLHDEWLALIAYSIGNVKFLNDKLVLYRQHENNITFSDSYVAKPTFFIRIVNDVKLLGKKQKFLPHQFILAKLFLAKCRFKLSNEQIEIIERFIKQEDKNYLFQRINRRLTYSKYFGRGQK